MDRPNPLTRNLASKIAATPMMLIVLLPIGSAPGISTPSQVFLAASYISQSDWSFTFTLAPASIYLQPGESVTFIASGGTGPYQFDLTQTNSGGSINLSNGLYTVQVTLDDQVVTKQVNVLK